MWGGECGEGGPDQVFFNSRGESGDCSQTAERGAWGLFKQQRGIVGHRGGGQHT